MASPRRCACCRKSSRPSNGRVEVLLDGGIRRGSDIVKALCLGARAVLIGRAYAYGLGAAGGAGRRARDRDPAHRSRPHAQAARRGLDRRARPVVRRSAGRLAAPRRSAARMTTTISRVEVRDIRFPTSAGRHGSDAMHPDPDYSAAYVILHTDRPDGLTGHGLTFTLGRGTELCVAAVHALAPIVLGVTLESIAADMAGFWRRLTSDSQLRWLGPEKGVIHLSTAALVNAVWDLWAKTERKPRLEAAGRHDAGSARGLHRLSLHHRRDHARRRGGAPARPSNAAALPAKRRSRGPDIRRTRPRRAGSAIRNPKSARDAGRPYPTAGRTSR